MYRMCTNRRQYAHGVGLHPGTEDCSVELDGGATEACRAATARVIPVESSSRHRIKFCGLLLALCVLCTVLAIFFVKPFKTSEDEPKNSQQDLRATDVHHGGVLYGDIYGNQAVPWVLCGAEQGLGSARHEMFMERLNSRNIVFIGDSLLRCDSHTSVVFPDRFLKTSVVSIAYCIGSLAACHPTPLEQQP